MAGQPLRRAMVAELERRAAAASTEDEPLTAIDYVCQRTAGGDTLREIARDIGQVIGHPDFQSGTLSSWINSSPDWRAKIALARSVSADILAEDAGEILDDADEDRDAIAKAKARADYRMWLASKRNRAVYGADTAQVAVQVNLPDLHIDAMRRRQVEAKVTPLLPSGPDVELA